MRSQTHTVCNPTGLADTKTRGEEKVEKSEVKHFNNEGHTIPA